MDKTVNLSQYGKKFQEILAFLIFQDRQFSNQIREILNVDFIEYRFLQVFLELIWGYKDKHGAHPSYEAMVCTLRSGLNEQDDIVRKQIRDFFAYYKSHKIIEEESFVKTSTIEFCKKQILKDVILESVDLLETGQFDLIRENITKSLKLGTVDDFGADFIEDFEYRYGSDSRTVISTGWPEIDAITKGGFALGEVSVVISYTGGGKTTVLSKLGAEAMKQGFNVAYYTMEMSPEQICHKFDAALSNVPLDLLKSNKTHVLKSIKKVPGRLFVKHFPALKATTNSIRNHLEKLQEEKNIKISKVIVDYPDLLTPIVSVNDVYHDMGRIFNELTGIAQEFNVSLDTASQSNRGGLNAEIVTMASIADSYKKAHPTDFIYTVSRTIRDLAQNAGRFFIAKNRFGQSGGVFPIVMFPGDMIINVLPQDYDVGDDGEQEEKETLSQKFKKYQKRRVNG